MKVTLSEIKKNLQGTISEKEEGFLGTCIKDTWTEPKGGRIKGGM